MHLLDHNKTLFDIEVYLVRAEAHAPRGGMQYPDVSLMWYDQIDIFGC